MYERELSLKMTTGAKEERKTMNDDQIQFRFRQDVIVVAEAEEEASGDVKGMRGAGPNVIVPCSSRVAVLTLSSAATCCTRGGYKNIKSARQ
jgi:hypothetical protein